ncbi:acetyl-CoA carboxylase carboxyl transferase subunit alpha [Methylacidimicrobium cyclopophantes]|uniref:Acetyl-coenzyme A carboxylase carboxyl transferase subunit alpha n=1 Tax=Methylacidimicrobium cyclopophantes TaxID=1041766 RepID=A0A5E6ML15_9BACT|nr:acetyl-CoA carboxylase carboxyltransferase subunit alpha [Methylacidimicrobium cyclopophantes]VVM06747.1 acetyl-CoA carboxylase carboxyl transferase subunit alpha [Methylacidimicrobium cyclopophantes]
MLLEKVTTTPLEFEKAIWEMERSLEDLKARVKDDSADRKAEVASLEKKLAEARHSLYASLTAWQRVQIARHPQRPYTLDFLERLAPGFLELGGDRAFGNDPAMVAGLATLAGRRVAFIGQQKGRNLKENLWRNFGCPHPEGYRKALRVMRLAATFGLPIVAFIDTPGAYPGVGAEERHIGQAIAQNLVEMSRLPVPIVAAVLGEGGSGGALGIGVADRILMLENAYYSVISPEGCAAILWESRSHAPQAAEALRLTAQDLHGMGLIDGIVPEPEGGSHRDWDAAARLLEEALRRVLDELSSRNVEELVRERYEKFRRYGVWAEGKDLLSIS